MLKALADLRNPAIYGLIVMCVLAGVVRFWNLGRMDTRADEVELLGFMKSGISTCDYLKREVGAFKSGRQMPVPRICTCLVIRTFHLKPSLLSIRLTFAFFGTMTILGLWLLGWYVSGRKLAWVLGFLGLINQYLVYWSRVAHVYAFIICFFTFASAYFAAVLRSIRSNDRISSFHLTLLSIFSILACYSHMSAWPVVGLLWLWLLVTFYMCRGIRGEGRWRLLIAFGIWALFLLPWVFVFISAMFTARGTFLQILMEPAAQFRRLSHLPLVMGWGGGIPRGIASIGLPLCAALAALVSRKWRNEVVFTFGFGLFMLVLIGVVQYAASGTFGWAIRYYMPLWVVVMLLSGIGIVSLANFIASIIRCRDTFVLFGLCAVMGIMMYKPILWTITLPGNPVPYSQVNKWMDQNLPKGAPVIVDRWFEPWNEMRYHAPTNVFVTFTIPDEPLEVFQKYQWRETAKQFFRKFPDAAYFEMGKHYFKVPEVGWWHWPREFFKRHVVFTNEQALALGSMSLMPCPFINEPGSNTNRVVVELFYNLPEDVVGKAKLAGKPTALLFGKGWGYVKLWQQIRGDFRDWRVLEKTATLDVYNLADHPQDVTVRITAVAPAGRKFVQSPSGVSHRFQPQKIETWQFDLNGLKPGCHHLKLMDMQWDRAHAPLLVGRVELTAREAVSKDK